MIFKDINIKELFQLMQEHDIAETTLQDGKAMLVVKRQKEPVIMNAGEVVARSHEGIYTQGVPEAEAAPPVPAKTDELEELGLEKHQPPGEESDNGYLNILAPLVGTFYQAPAPDVPPFVEVGDHIDANDVVCIVEAMKSMNEIQSDVKGVVKEICVENAQMVEFGQVLFKVDPNG
ncbi:acetyl-CoA carboxylase biotin carboxyl carrier protein [Acidobacteriota bacterium]